MMSAENLMRWKQMIVKNEEVIRKLESGEIKLWHGPGTTSDGSQAEAARLREINELLARLIARELEGLPCICSHDPISGTMTVTPNVDCPRHGELGSLNR